MRLMLFRDGRYPRYAFPVLAEYISPNVCPRKGKGWFDVKEGEASIFRPENGS
jgi:hypothetical protein